MIRLALLASGNGSNVQQIAEFFLDKPQFEIAVVIVNKADAFVRKRAANLGLECLLIENREFLSTNAALKALEDRNIDWIVLAGFLLRVPETIIRRYENRILNIHPALLPAYGGKGMYGMNVHQAVVGNHENKSGISIHLVNEEYDKGRILFQATCYLTDKETPETLATKIHALEKTYFPSVIASACLQI
ncbi:MAG: phosphoribosylglycinamide formyltransferase [Bacteroidales bacterium]|jgi:phosphoribosylglycinamide formyltransferase-1|nr:phosphoribosylglycinamide formyltransferase [Bacteroidales bacterium]